MPRRIPKESSTKLREIYQIYHKAIDGYYAKYTPAHVLHR